MRHLLIFMAACIALTGVAFAQPRPPATWLGDIAEDSLAGPGLVSKLLRIVAGGENRQRLGLPFDVQIAGDEYFVLSRQSNDLVAIDRRSQKARVLHISDQPLITPVAAVGTPEHYFISDPEQNTVFVGHGTDLEVFVGTEQGLERPTGLAWDRQRNRIWVVDTGRHEVLCFDLAGKLIVAFGGRGAGDTDLNYPTFIAVAPDGSVIVNDTMNGRIKKWSSDGEFLWSSSDLLTASDPVGRAKALAIDETGRTYVVDNMEDRIVVFDSEGTQVGTFGHSGSGNGELWSPVGIAIAGDTLVVADTQNNRLALFAITREEQR